MRRIYQLFFFLLAIPLWGALYTDPNAVPRVPGTDVGVVGGIPTNRNTLIDVTQAPYSADKTGATDASTAITSAINAAGALADGHVVYLPAGTYRINSQIGPTEGLGNYTIRGDVDASGAPTTHLDFHLTTGSGLSLGTGEDYLWSYPTGGIAISGTMTKGTTTLTVADTSYFTVGDMFQITEDNDTTLPVVYVTSVNTPKRSQRVKCVAKGVGTIDIFPGLYWTLTSGLNPRAYTLQWGQVSRAVGIGVENLYLDGTNTADATFLLAIQQGLGCWVKNVRTYKHPHYDVYLSDCLLSEVRHCYFDTAQNQGSGTGGLLVQRCSAVLVEDNIFHTNSLEVNGGSNGCVFGYNYSTGLSISSEVVQDFTTNHGPQNSNNLYEGNQIGMLMSDGYFGGESEITVFRNWATGYCPGIGYNRAPVQLNRFTRNAQVIGNLVGVTGLPFKYFNGTVTTNLFLYGRPGASQTYTGTASLINATPWADWAAWLGGATKTASDFQELDEDVVTTTNQLGNWNAIDGAIPVAEALGTTTLPNSLYRTSKPTWFASLTWPTFDPTSPPSVVTYSGFAQDVIPAGYRYVHGVDPSDAASITPAHVRRGAGAEITI